MRVAKGDIISSFFSDDILWNFENFFVLLFFKTEWLGCFIIKQQWNGFLIWYYLTLMSKEYRSLRNEMHQESLEPEYLSWHLKTFPQIIYLQYHFTMYVRENLHTATAHLIFLTIDSIWKLKKWNDIERDKIILDEIFFF